MMKLINYTLPEFVLLDGKHKNEDTLEHRTVIQHVRSYTIVEAVALEEVFDTQAKNAYHEFKFKNRFGVVENHRLILHFTMSEDEELPDIFKKIENWYIDYMNWEDLNIKNDSGATFN